MEGNSISVEPQPLHPRRPASAYLPLPLSSPSPPPLRTSRQCTTPWSARNAFLYVDPNVCLTPVTLLDDIFRDIVQRSFMDTLFVCGMTEAPRAPATILGTSIMRRHVDVCFEENHYCLCLRNDRRSARKESGDAPSFPTSRHFLSSAQMSL